MAEVEASDGTKLYAEAHGDGVPVLFSCALCTTHENWRPQVATLVEAGFRAVLWDYRGHGRSEAPDDPAAYRMEQVIDDLGRVLAFAGGDGPPVLLGLSFGGLASLHYTIAHPGSVRALVLVSSGPGFKKPEAQAGWEKSVERTASYVETKGPEAFAASRAAPTLVGLHPDRPAAQAAARAIAAQQGHGLAHFARRVAGPAAPVIDALPEIDVPALILLGENDAAYARAAEVMTARLPRAQRAEIPRAGHISNLDEPEVFDAELLRFLRSLAEAS